MQRNISADEGKVISHDERPQPAQRASYLSHIRNCVAGSETQEVSEDSGWDMYRITDPDSEQFSVPDNTYTYSRRFVLSLYDGECSAPEGISGESVICSAVCQPPVLTTCFTPLEQKVSPRSFVMRLMAADCLSSLPELCSSYPRGSSIPMRP